MRYFAFAQYDIVFITFGVNGYIIPIFYLFAVFALANLSFPGWGRLGSGDFVLQPQFIFIKIAAALILSNSLELIKFIH